MSAAVPAQPGHADVLRRLAEDPQRTPEERIALIVAARTVAEAFAPPPPNPDREPDYYRLEPVWQWSSGDPGGMPIATAALVTCVITGRTLSGSGGPDLAIATDLVPEDYR